MPLYRYQCNNDHEFEVVEPMGASTERRCTMCRCKARRIMSLTNVNVDAVMQPGDMSYTPPMSHHIGRRRWQKKQEAKRAAEGKSE